MPFPRLVCVCVCVCVCVYVCVCMFADFVLLFAGKQQVWCAFDREPFNEFLFCLVELCRQSFRTVPAVRGCWRCTIRFFVGNIFIFENERAVLFCVVV